MISIGYCDTSNDLRHMLGMNVLNAVDSESYLPNSTGIGVILQGREDDDTPNSNNDTENTETDLDNMGVGDVPSHDEGTEQSSDNESAESENIDNTEEEITAVYYNGIYGETDFSNLEDKVNESLIVLESSIVSVSSAKIIVGAANKYLENRDNLNKVLSANQPVLIDGIYYQTNKDPNANDYKDIIDNIAEDQKIDDLNSLDFNIGNIGSQAISVVDNRMTLVTPWGFTKHASEEKFSTSKMLGVNLYALPNDAIKSQWNGVVVEIGNDTQMEGYEYIKVYHGNYLYTTYSHVVSEDGLKVGSKVHQGMTIGYACDTTDYSNLDNHIFYQISLDGQFINPIFIYGPKGQKLYESWLTSYPYDNVVESGESYFNGNDYDPDWDKGVVPDVIYPDFNKDS